MQHSLKEIAFRIVSERNLCSYMNNTKWDELITAIKTEMLFRRHLNSSCREHRYLKQLSFI